MRGMGRTVALTAAVVLSSTVTGLADPPSVLLAQAGYVKLGYELGVGFVSENPVPAEALPEERMALEHIRTELQKWGRFVIVDGPGQADLHLAVRKGRPLSGGVVSRPGDPTAGRPGGPPLGTRTGAGVQLSTPQDTIIVYDGRIGGIAWRGTLAEGLSGSSPPLWEAFKAEVEKADRLAKKKKP